MENQPQPETTDRMPSAAPRPELGRQRHMGPFQTDHDYIQNREAQASLHSVQSVMDSCTMYGVEALLDMEEGLCSSGLFDPSSDHGGILALEHTLLELSANPELAQGVFYMLPMYHKGQLFIRYMESGYCKGFLDSAIGMVRKYYPQARDNNILPWRVYTEKDMDLYRAHRSSTSTDPSRQYDRKLGSDTKGNGNSVNNLLLKLKPKLDNFRTIIFVHKAKSSRDNPYHRFLHTSRLHAEDVDLIDHQFGDQIHAGSQNIQDGNSILSHVSEMHHLTLKDQFLLLSSISNYHYMEVPGVKNSRKMYKEKSPRYATHLVYHPDWENESARKYMPTSPRNRLIYFVSTEAYCDHAVPLIKYLLNKDQGNDAQPTDEFDVPQPPRKKRKQAVKLTTVTNEDLLQSIGSTAAEIRALNQATGNRPLYNQFQESLLSQGTIKWRLHDIENGRDVCVMTDVNPSTGVLQPSNFAHVTCVKQLMGEPLLKCTCDIYKMIKRAAKNDTPLLPNHDDDDASLDSNLTCMHCRFFRDHLFNGYDDAIQQGPNVTKSIQMVQRSLQYMNYPVQLLGQVLPQGTTKFSVNGSDNFANIHFTFHQGKCFAKCTNGMCATQMRNKKKIAKKVHLEDGDKVCPHLQTLYANFDYVKAFFPHYFNDEDIQFNLGPAEEVNMDDVNVDEEDDEDQSKTFNPVTGLWNYPALSQHKPFQKFDNPLLVRSTRQRNDIVNSTNFDEAKQTYVGLELKPDRCGNCQCGASFANGTYAAVNHGKLYTRMGVVDCTCFDLPCDSGTCTRSWHQVAEKRGIFFSTKKTAIGDEIGWDFVEAVRRTKVSFSAFCTEMSRKYTTNQPDASPFISPKVFIKWFFAWISAFKIDYREEVDPWCQYNPKVVACDGTHIGVAVRNLNIEDPVTKSDEDRMVETRHLRKDRMLLCDNRARAHLNYLCRKVLKMKIKDVLSTEMESKESAHLITTVRDLHEPKLYSMISAFVFKTEEKVVIEAMARLLIMNSVNAPMSTVLPFQSHPLVALALDEIRGGSIIQSTIDELKNYSIEVADLIVISGRNGCVEMVANFMEYIVYKINVIHNEDAQFPEAEPIAGTYNPPSGVAYYFTRSGEQVRKMPKYDTTYDKNRRKGQEKEEETCRKNYPSVSYGGFGYMFLFFCPIHGHTFGFHLISGGEGRKDPFSALFKYTEEPPEEVFYDFACGLSEYSLTREPRFFKNTRFWHDLFHGATHGCGDNFKSGHVRGLEGLNTEICEQTNSYLQCLKYTASHLHQAHFVLFMQFFLYLWNVDKTKKFQQQASVALAGVV